jgi:hypothetical protein
MLIGVVRHFHRVAIVLTRMAGIVVHFELSPTRPVMSTPTHRPEDRQRNGACDVGWCAAGPDIYRSEAFAEDLTAPPSGTALTLLATQPPASPMATRAGWSLFGVSLAALLGASTPR